MSFISKLWKDRVSDYPNKRKLTKEDGTSETVTVERAEGDIVVAGDAFNAENMNDLETRIQNGFNAVEQAQAELNEKILAETVDFGVVQINAGSTTGLAIPTKDGYTIASATPYSNSGSESTQTNVITFVNAVSGAKKAFYKNTSSSAISNRLMVDVIYVKE